LRPAAIKNLIERVGAVECGRRVAELIATGRVRSTDISVRGLWEATVGPVGETLAAVARQRGFIKPLQEAAVDSTAFSAVFGQILFSRVMNEYSQDIWVCDQLVDTIQTTQLSERAPGFQLQDENAEVNEGMPYPEAGMTDEYVGFVSGKKRGEILSITEEAVFRDNTGFLLRKAGNISHYLRQQKEQRILNVVTGTTNAYRINGTNTALYSATAASAGGHGNLVATNALVDWTDVDAVLALIALQRESDMTTPVVVMVRQVLVPKALFATAMRVLDATGNYYLSRVNAAAGTPDTQYGMQGSNPYAGQYALVSTPLLDALSTSSWYMMDGPRAFVYRQHWPLQMFRQGADSDLAFERDIVVRFKVREWGTAEVIDHRSTYQSTA